MRFRSLLVPALALVALATAQTQAGVVTLVSDTFDVPAGAATRGDDAADPLDTAWYGMGAFIESSPVVASDTGGGLAFTSDVLYVNPGEDATSVAAGFAPVTLTNIGDSITLTVAMRFPNGRTNGGGFNIGLFNDGGTALTSDNDSAASDDSGYLMNVGVPSGTSSGSSSIKKDTAGLYVSPVKLGSNANSGMSGDGVDEKRIAELTLVIELTGVNEVSMTGDFTNFSIDQGRIPFTRTDTNSPITTFNEIGINWAWGQAYLLDDVTVTANIVPEPASLALAATGLMVLLGRRRRAA